MIFGSGSVPTWFYAIAIGVVICFFIYGEWNSRK